MKTIILCLFLCVMSSTSFAASLPQSIAFEFQEHGEFTGIIGKAYVTEKAIEVVTFAEQSGEIIPFAFIYTILERRGQMEGIYSIKCRSQLGVVSTGTIDVRDVQNPKLNLISDTGITLTNISESGKKMKNKYLPKVNLGR